MLDNKIIKYISRNMKIRYIVMIFIIIANIANAILKFESYIYEKQITDDANFIEFLFKFKNISGQSINILDIDADCGCINISSDEMTILKGKCSTIGTISIEGKIGLIEKRITVMTDTLVSNRINLKIKVNIIPVLSLNKRFLFWRIGETIKSQQITANLKNTTYKYQDINYDKKVVSVNIEHISPTQLRLEIVPLSTAKPTKTQVNIALIGKNGNEKKYLIPIYIK